MTIYRSPSGLIRIDDKIQRGDCACSCIGTPCCQSSPPFIGPPGYATATHTGFERFFGIGMSRQLNSVLELYPYYFSIGYSTGDGSLFYPPSQKIQSTQFCIGEQQDATYTRTMLVANLFNTLPPSVCNSFGYDDTCRLYWVIWRFSTASVTNTSQYCVDYSYTFTDPFVQLAVLGGGGRPRLNDYGIVSGPQVVLDNLRYAA